MAPLSQVFGILNIAMILFLGGFLSWLDQALAPVVAKLETEETLTVYLSPQLAAADEAQLIDRVKVSIAHADAQPQVKVVRSREFLDEIARQYPDLANELAQMGPEGDLMIPRYISITGILPPGIGERVRSLVGVEGIDSSGDRLRPVAGAFSALRWLVRALSFGLALALFAAMAQLGRLNFNHLADALATLRFWGADAFQAAIPGLLAGIFVGVLGGILGALVWIGFSGWLGSELASLSEVLGTLPAPELELAWLLLVFGAACGICAGGAGMVHGGDRAG